MSKKFTLPITINLNRENTILTQSPEAITYEEEISYSLKKTILHLASFIAITSSLFFVLILSYLNQDPEHFNFNGMLFFSFILLPLVYFNFSRAYEYFIDGYRNVSTVTSFTKLPEITRVKVISRVAPKNKIFIKFSDLKIDFVPNHVAFTHLKEKDSDGDLRHTYEIILIDNQGKELRVIRLVDEDTSKPRLLNAFSRLYDISIHPDIVVDKT